MLFHLTHTYKAGYTHEDQKNMVEIWSKFEPPEGFDTKWHVFAPNGTMYSLVEAPSAEAVFEACALWAGVYLDYEVVPVIDVEAMVPLVEKAIATRES